MKKNITMNLFGTLYAIDEDAYELLNNYLNGIKQYFLRKGEDGEEIYGDIEHRMAELLSELQAQGVTAFNIDHVKDLIERIGSPEEMDGNPDGETISGATHAAGFDEPVSWLKGYFNRIRKKSLYRNPDDLIVGGVSSGIASFLGVNSVWVRIAAILFMFLSFGSFFIVYLLLWMIVPLAQTPADRLQMKGVPVNMENIRDEVMSDSKRRETQDASRFRSVRSAVVKALVILLLAPPFLFCSVLMIFFLVAIFTVAFGYLSAKEPAGMVANIFPDFEYFYWGDTIPVVWVCGISAVIFLGLVLYMMVHFVLRRFSRVTALSVSQRTACIVGCVLSLVVSVSAFVVCEATWSKNLMEVETREHAEDLDKQKETLLENGWTIVRDRGCEHYTSSWQYYTGNRQRVYIDGYSPVGLEYEVEKTVKVAPGTYLLKAAVRADGEGAFLFVASGSRRHLAAIPANGDKGGDIWQNAVAQCKNDSLSENVVMQRIAKAHNGKGYGWNEVVAGPIEVTDSLVRYGVTNVVSGEPWTGTWFSAADFKLERVK